MTSVMDAGDSMIDPQSEVRKLQDLVKKLEKQNEVLRSKQKLTVQDHNLPNGDALKQGLGGINNSVFYNTRKQSEKRESVSSVSSDPLETTELIDIEKSVNESEDSWLYMSPRPPTPQQTRVSPYKWVRQDLDNPSPALESARKSLKHKLDEVARMSRSSSTPAFSNYSTPPRGHPVAMSQSADSTPSPRATPGEGLQSPRIQRPLGRYAGGIPAGSRGVDTGTFTRPKKNRERPSLENTPRADDMKENIESQKHHQNVTDIENLAKLQEESLRQSIAQTSPRRGFRSRPLPNVAHINSELENNSPAGSNRSSPARYEVEGMNRRNSQSNNSVGSDNSSPPDSPYGSTQQLHSHGSVSSNMRGSLPNVSRLAVHAQHHASDSSLADYQQDDYTPPDPRYNRIQGQNQLPRPSSPNVSGLKQPQRNLRGLSPQRTGLPQSTRRSIPRPGTPGKSGVPTPRRSGIPSPRSNNNSQSYGGDTSWKEGCF